MATLGITTQGASVDSVGGNSVRSVLLPVMPEDGVLTHLGFWTRYINTTDREFKIGIWDSSDNLIATSDDYAGAVIGGTATDVQLAVPGSVNLTSGEQYRVGSLPEYTGTGYYYTSGSGQTGSSSGSFASPPDPIVIGGNTTAELSAYLVYTATTTATRNVTNTTPSGYTSYQFGDVSGVNTAAGSGSLFSTDYIIAEDDHQITIETPVDGVDLTIDDQGNWSTDAAGLTALNLAGSIDVQVTYNSPSTGNTSGMVFTINKPVTEGSTPVISGSSDIAAVELLPFSENYTITNRESQLPTLSGTDAALFTITQDAGDLFSLSKLTNVEAAGASYDVTIDIDNGSNTDSLAITITSVVPAQAGGTTGIHIRIGIGI